MKSKRSGQIILVFIFCCHAVGMLLFCKGFLLKRVVIPEYSQCTVHNQQNPAAPNSNSNHKLGNSCGEYPKQFKRVLWLLIDALRYDFMLYDDTLKDPIPIFRNKIPFVRDLLREKSENARLFKFVADPPTTTMQRLKALTTGSLPTFIDVGSNFNSYEILEDSLPYQAKNNGRNITFIGDDTWLGLYPNMLNKIHDYPSLNVKDLHTVDNGVIKHLLPELALNDAEIVVGHMLGVDHVGHTYGPSHWTMGEKLSQMNGVLQSVLTSVDEDTIVFVFGDHGMTPTGDHGGETHLETDAALLVYTPRPMFDPREPSIGRSVYQIDLVPTISLLLGIPVPFSSLGMIIPEMFLPHGEEPPQLNEDKLTPQSRSIEDGFSGRVTFGFLTALRINARQLHTYLETYAQYSRDFPSDTFHMLEKEYQGALESHQNIESSGKKKYPSQRELTDVATAYVGYMKKVKTMCQRIWAKFDDVPITHGLILLILVVMTSPLMLLDVEVSIVTLKQVLPLASVFGALPTVLGALFFEYARFELSLNGIMTLLASYFFYSLVTSNLLFVLYIRKNILKLMQNGMESLKHGVSLLQLLSVGIIVLYSVSMLSNSFVLYEADMVAFFMQTMIFCFGVRKLQTAFPLDTDKSTKYPNNSITLWNVAKIIAPHFMLMVCIRTAKVFYACRDLQIQDGCEATTFIHSLPTVYELLGWLAKWRFLTSCVGIVSIPIALILLLKRNKNFRYLNSWLVTAVTFGFPVASLSSAGYWAIQALPQTTLLSLSHWQHITLPWIVYIISISTITLTIFRPFRRHLFNRPLTMSCEDPPNEERDVDDGVITGQVSEKLDTGVVDDTTRLRRQKLSGNTDEEWVGKKKIFQAVPQQMARTMGRYLTMMTVMVVSMLLVALWIPIAMLLNDGLALSAVLMVAQVILFLQAIPNTGKSTSWEVVVLWGLMCCHCFFSFGHHATVTSLRFEAAFTGIHGEITKYNIPLAGILVGLNTLASHLLFGLGLPLLLMLDGTDGNNDDSSRSVKLLRLMIQYIVFHSVKMLVTVFAASIHRRHLMVWWVFTPRFMYEGAFQATTDVCMILIYALVIRMETLVLN